MIKPRLFRLEAMCAQKQVWWKQVQAGAKVVNVIVRGQRSLTLDVWMQENETGAACGQLMGSYSNSPTPPPPNTHPTHTNTLTPYHTIQIWIVENDPNCNAGFAEGFSCWLSEIKIRKVEEEKRKKKHSTKLKFTRSFPTRALSKLNKTTQAATYQTCLHARTFFLSPLCVCECDTESFQFFKSPNIGKTFKMLRICIIFLNKKIMHIYSF